MQLSTDRLLTEVEVSTGKMAGVIGNYDPGLAVPSCPDWTLRQLGTHVGRVHRWAAEIVTTRVAEGIPMKATPDGVPPADPSGQADWLMAGARRLSQAIRAAGSEPVWAFGGLAPATFWARRQAHETMVHRADAELAAGRPVVLDPELAADAIDEWLTVMAAPRYGRPDARAAALPAGASLHVLAIAPDERGTGSGDWLITQAEGGVTVQTAPDATGPDDLADLTMSGRPDQVLLTLLGRLSPAAAGITVSGDASLLARWLAGTPFR
ncbi:MAG: maleylpyruvate isomerase family mycothiol-dependent enzyme [Streptosporangiaceae bacterium]